jgi:hypothetical protein
LREAAIPWTAADAPSHNKKTKNNPHLQKVWAAAANAALKQYDGDEGKAIAVANSAVDKAAKKGRDMGELEVEIEPLRGWHPGMIETRLAKLGPTSYDRDAHTVEADLSFGSPVQRFYGTEVLRIHDDAVDLGRLRRGGIPILDSHNQNSITSALGKLQRAWVEKKALRGEILFHQTPAGQMAEGMVARKEITGISAGYRVEEWEITDPDGRVIDPEVDRLRLDDELTFTAGNARSLPAVCQSRKDLRQCRSRR